jgi:DNA polymerase (family 10)
MNNKGAAKAVFSIASLLESLGANPYRVRAYRRAALRLLRLQQEAGQFTNSAGELALPWLGKRLRRKLGELVISGRMQFVDDLMNELPPELRALLGVPGVGPKTAARLIGELGITSVAQLADAARAGKLRTLYTIGRVREQQLGAAAEALLNQDRSAA